jgi:TATA-box binding protein (TBP) (component of TFIID and TFIIIB)
METFDDEELEHHLKRDKYNKKRKRDGEEIKKKRKRSQGDENSLVRRMARHQRTHAVSVKNRNKFKPEVSTDEYELKIQNVVINFTSNLDWNSNEKLYMLKELFKGAYSPWIFAALKITLGGLNEPRTTFSLYESNGGVITGAKSLAEAVYSIYRLIYKMYLFDPLRRVVRIFNLVLTNIVASSAMNIRVDLNKCHRNIKLANPDWYVTSPETFPSVFASDGNKKKTKMLLFGSGKFAIVGVRSFADYLSFRAAQPAVRKLLLKSSGVTTEQLIKCLPAIKGRPLTLDDRKKMLEEEEKNSK